MKNECSWEVDIEFKILMRKVKSPLKQTTPLQICSAPFLNSPEQLIVISRREWRDDRKYVCSSQATLLAMINGIWMPNWWPIFESLSISRLHDSSHWYYWLLIDKILIIDRYLLITDIFMQVNCFYSSQHFFLNITYFLVINLYIRTVRDDNI